ncbi:MAG: DNA polymerase II [Chitinispirillaceae bacterium]|nr:DNA polymerase II [Chitinispirillaceae bacterium]
MSPVTSQTCFLLSHGFHDHTGHFEIVLYGVDEQRTPVKMVIDSFRPLFFVPRTTPAAATTTAAERRPLPLCAMKNGKPVDCLYFSTYAAFSATGRALREKTLTVYESDVHPVERFLMERFVAGAFKATGSWSTEGPLRCCRNPQIRGAPMQPRLQTLSLDIETNARSGEILSIACSGERDTVFIRGAGSDEPPIFFCHDEKTLLLRFFEHLRFEDPDLIIGWNVVEFDLATVQQRCESLRLPFDVGRDRGARITVAGRDGRKTARLPGRAVADVPSMLRANFHTFEEYSLDFVASAMLGKHKTVRQTGREKIDEIIRRFDNDPLSLARYNLLDAQLTKEIFERAALLPNMIERSRRSGHLIDRTGGSVAAFDFLYLPRLHRAGYVAPDAIDVPQPLAPLPGGHVLEPIPGLYENVLVFDFRSLYPSLIQTFNIDPLALVSPSPSRVRGPEGPSFASETGILPGIIAELMEARAQAKRENNPYLSQAIKILMNSFYGVLGAVGCRFFSPDIAAAITKTGRYILKQTITHIEQHTGHPVIYGDTDSLFVHIGPGKERDAKDLGRVIAENATTWLSRTLRERFSVESALLLQFEEHYRYFFLPPLRGSAQGSKKHYCGATVNDTGMNLTFKGMESARSDWTDLAKEFQHELFIRFFNNQPLDAFIMETVSRLRSGRADELLVYKKRLRKRLDEYTDHLPPHVQAAKLLDEPPHLIRYYITTQGPQPVEKRSAPLDYDHYVESQIRPIADSVLETTGTSFDRIASGQQELF